MRRKRFPGEYHGRDYLEQPNPELSRYLQKCGKQNTVDRPSQLNYSDPWADWTKYPLVAWPQPQFNKEGPCLGQNSNFSPHMETPYNGQDTGEHLPAEQGEVGSSYCEVSENSESSEAGAAASLPKKNVITEGATYEESNPENNSQTTEEMIEDKREEKEAANFESMEQKQTQDKSRQVEVKENTILIWRGFPK